MFTLYMLIRQQFLAFPAYLCEYERHPQSIHGHTFLF
jgi:hypothetical protein